MQVIREKNAERQVNARVGFAEPPSDYVAPQFATGGETRGEGLAYLHPNEAILNSSLTKKLGEFLAISSTPATVTYGDTHININVDHIDNDTDLNALAEKLMKIMDRKIQLKKMAVRV